MKIAFGSAEHEFILLEVLGYERSPVGEWFDDNWLQARIHVAAGGFRGSAAAALLTDELVRFASQVHLLHETLGGLAEFTTIEGQLALTLTGDKKGRVDLKGTILDRPGLGNRLDFSLRLDQSQLGSSFKELEAVAATFLPENPAHPLLIGRPRYPSSPWQTYGCSLPVYLIPSARRCHRAL
jgi:hypothetical protein